MYDGSLSLQQILEKRIENHGLNILGEIYPEFDTVRKSIISSETIMSTFGNYIIYHAFTDTRKYEMKLNLAKHQGDLLNVVREGKESEFSWYVTYYG